MEKLRVKEMDEVLDFWNLMAYDFAGSWDAVAGHQANLLGKPEGPSVDKAVGFYMHKGVHPSKLVIGNLGPISLTKSLSRIRNAALWQSFCQYRWHRSLLLW